MGHNHLHHSSCECLFCQDRLVPRQDGEIGRDYELTYGLGEEIHHAKCGCSECRNHNLWEHQRTCDGCWLCDLPYTDCEADCMFENTEIGDWIEYGQYSGYEEGFLFGTRWVDKDGVKPFDEIPF